MKTYSYSTTPEEVIWEHLPHKYSMELNKNDMINLLHVLKNVSEDRDDWAVGFRIGILSTIDIEEI